MIDIARIFKSGSKPNQKIRVLREIQVKDADGVMRFCQPGDELTVSYRTALELDRDDFKNITPTDKQLDEVADPSPVRQDPAPMPEAWKALPDCFAEYWQLSEAFRTAREHVSAFEQVRREVIGTNLKIAGGEGTAFVASAMQASRHDKNVHVNGRTIDLDDPVLKKQDRFLTAAENAARDHLRRLIEDKEIPLQRAHYACGIHRLDIAEKLQALVDELSETGFNLFSVRVASLGLSEWKRMNLYQGSADFVKYGSHQPAYTGGACWGGVDHGTGETRRFCDDPVAETAGHTLREIGRIEELSKVLTEAKAELTKANRAAKAAA